MIDMKKQWQQLNKCALAQFQRVLHAPQSICVKSSETAFNRAHFEGIDIDARLFAAAKFRFDYA